MKLFLPPDFFGLGAPIPSFSLAGPEPKAGDALPPEQRYFGGKYRDYAFDQSGRFWGANIEFVDANTEILPGVTLVATSSPASV